VTRTLLAAVLVVAGVMATAVGLWLAFGLPGVLLAAGPAAVTAGLLFVDVDGGGASGKPAE
jgi:hypothetical protein